MEHGLFQAHIMCNISPCSWPSVKEQLKCLATWGQLTQRPYCSRPLPWLLPWAVGQEGQEAYLQKKRKKKSLMIWRTCKHVRCISANTALINAVAGGYIFEHLFFSWLVWERQRDSSPKVEICTHSPLTWRRLWRRFPVHITLLEFHERKESRATLMQWKPMVAMYSNVKKTTKDDKYSMSSCCLCGVVHVFLWQI